MSMMDALNKYDKNAFVKMAKFSVSASTRASVEKDIEDLKEISEHLWSQMDPAPSEDFAKTIHAKLTENKSDFTSKECRIMSLYPHEIAQDDEKIYFKIAYILEQRWNDAYLRRLLCFIFNNWKETTKENSSSYLLYSLFLKKIKSYNGKVERLNFWKKNSDCFSVNGPQKTGESLRMQKNVTPLAATEQLKIPESYFSSHYFDDVIRSFYYGISDIPKDLETVLERHGDFETKKVVLSDLITRTKNDVQLLNQRKSLQYLAVQIIGHPSRTDLWRSESDDQKTDEKIKTAAKIVNQWLIEVYVEEIFDNFFHDNKRRDYWMKYAKAGVIEDVKIVGKNDIWQKLIFTPSLKDVVEYNFIKVKTGKFMQCAFVMQIKGYNIVEFSDSNNALYVYHDDSVIKRLEMLNKHTNFTSIENLKNTKLPLSKYVDERNDCRFAHYDGWQGRLDWWFKGRGINV